MNLLPVRAKLIAAFFALFIISPWVVVAAPLTLEDQFRHFEFLNIAQIYERYSGIIDLIIYTLIFVGLAQAVLTNHYPGRGGRAVAIGVGLSLAISMLLAEEAFGFGLRSFGPYAAGLIVLTLGIMTYRLVHSAGLPRSAAAGLAYILIFLSTRAIAPQAFEWAQEEVPILTIGLTLVLLVSLFTVIAGLIPQNAVRVVALSMPRARAHKDAARSTQKRRVLADEANTIKKRGRTAVRKELQDGNILLSNLTAIRNAIRKHGGDPKTHGTILRALRQATPKEEELWRDIHNVRELNKRLLAFDEAVLSEDLQARLKAHVPIRVPAGSIVLHRLRYCPFTDSWVGGQGMFCRLGRSAGASFPFTVPSFVRCSRIHPQRLFPWDCRQASITLFLPPEGFDGTSSDVFHLSAEWRSPPCSGGSTGRASHLPRTCRGD